MTETEADQPPPGWVRTPANIDGVPIWRRPDEPCYVATRDMDQLRFIGAALTQFDQMSGPEYHAFIEQHKPDMNSASAVTAEHRPPLHRESPHNLHTKGANRASPSPAAPKINMAC